MPAVSNCPKCDRQVSLPQHADAQARVRCPLCEGEYRLEDALALAPPELVLLDVPIDESATAAAAGYPSAAGEPYDAEAAGVAVAEQQGEAEDADSPWDETVAAESQWDAAGLDGGADDLAVSEATIDGAELEHLLVEQGEGEDLLAEQGETAVDEDETDLAEREHVGALVPVAEEFNFGQGAINAASATDFDVADAARDLPKMVPLPRRKQGSSFLRQMVGVFGGGIVGLSLGYIILLWIGGPRSDFLKLGPKLPSVIVPSSFHESATSRNRFESEPLPDMNESVEEWNRRMHASVRPDDEPPMVSLMDPEVPSRPGQKTDPRPARGILERDDDDDDLPAADNEDAPPETPEPPEENGTGAGDPKPTPPAPEEVPLRDADRFTAAELGAALKDAFDAKAKLTAGDFSDPEVKTAKLDAYRKFCRLGEVYSLVAGTSGMDQLDSRKLAVEELLAMIADAEDGLLDLGLIGESWLSRDRKERGVFLVGTVLQVEKEGKFFASLVVPFGQSRPVSVLTLASPPWHIDDTAVLLGCIVGDPKSNLVGYEGDSPKAIWASLALKGGPAAF